MGALIFFSTAIAVLNSILGVDVEKNMRKVFEIVWLAVAEDLKTC